MWSRLRTVPEGWPCLGLVHGNGGLGGYQGVAILGATR